MQQHINSKRTPCRKAGMFSLLLCVLLLSGCEKEDHDYPPAIEPVRTVLFYIGADNNLSGEAGATVRQLAAAPLAANCRMLVYADTEGEQPRLLEWRVENGEWRMKTANTYPEHNSASAEVLGEVLREVKQLYPSPSYGLVVFSHSSGWLPEGSLGNPKLRATSPPTPKGGVVNSSPLGGRGAGAILQSVIIDNGSEMELPAFAEAIPDGMLDFIIFDACYMAGVEVAYELKDKARYVVASSAEVVSPGFIPVYTTEALSLLFQPKADLQGFCQRIEADYRKRQGDYGSLTLSLISTRGLDDLAAALNNKCFDDNDLKNKIGLTPTGGGTSIQAFDRGGGTLFFDLADSYKELMTGEERTAFQAAIDGCVLWKAATPAFLPNYGGFQVRAHCGLTTYLPQERYPKLNEAYKGLKWSQAIRN